MSDKTCFSFTNVDTKYYVLLFTELCTHTSNHNQLNTCIGVFKSPKCDVNPQPNRRGIVPLVGRTSGTRCSVMYGLVVIWSKTFPKRPSGAPLHSLSKLYDVPVGFVNPPPLF